MRAGPRLRDCLAFAVLALFGADAMATDAPVDPRITLQLVEADIHDALRFVSRQGDVDVVVSNNVTGQVTLELEDATLMEALDAITSVGGLVYAVDGRIVTVKTYDDVVTAKQKQEEISPTPPPPAPVPPPLKTLVIKLAHVDAERVRPVVEKLLSDRGSVVALKTPDHVAQERGGTSGGVNGAAAVTDLEIGTRLTTSTQGQPAKSHTLVVVDVAERLAPVEEVVRGIDVKPVQLLIEARFVEITLGRDDQLGIDWNVVVRAAGAAAPHTYPFGSSSFGQYDPHGGTNTLDGVFPPVPTSVTTPAEAGLFTFGTLDFTALAAILRMIERDARAEVVSNPRILVRDRHTATILVGERYPILSTNITDFGTVTEELDHYEPIGVQLEVTPSVLGGDEVELFVRPSTSSLGGLVEGSTGLQVVRIATRQIDTSITARSGQTVVLGGLISSRDVETERSVPLLGEIPALGRLFRYDTVVAEKVDLVVFLTVTVLREPRLSDTMRGKFDESSLRSERYQPPSIPRKPLLFSSSAPEY